MNRQRFIVLRDLYLQGLGLCVIHFVGKTGNSLSIHLAYYFSIQEASKKNEILKDLL